MPTTANASANRCYTNKTFMPLHRTTSAKRTKKEGTYTKKQLILGLLFLSIMILSNTVFTVSATNYAKVGVKVGDTADYTYSTWTDATGDDNKLYVFLADIYPPTFDSISCYQTNGYNVLSRAGFMMANLTISLAVSDNVAVSSVRLYYKPAGAGAWNTVAMTLVGTTYSATIGWFSFGTNVSYYVNATDTSGNVACTPSNAPSSYYNFTVAPPPTPTSPNSIYLIGGAIAAVAMTAIIALVLRSKKSKGRRKTSKWENEKSLSNQIGQASR